MSDDTTKRCTKCGEIKPLTAFDRSTKWVDGRRGQCKACRKLQRATTPSSALPHDVLKRCTTCGKHKAAGDFHLSGESSDGRAPSCKECACARARAWKAENKAKIRAYEQANRESLSRLRNDWRKANHDRYLTQRRISDKTPKRRLYNRLRQQNRRVGKTGSVTREQIQALMAQQTRCYYCRKPFTDKRKPTLDHVIPLAKGGAHDISNLVLACKPCNCQKQARMLRLL